MSVGVGLVMVVFLLCVSGLGRGIPTGDSHRGAWSWTRSCALTEVSGSELDCRSASAAASRGDRGAESGVSPIRDFDRSAPVLPAGGMPVGDRAATVSHCWTTPRDTGRTPAPATPLRPTANLTVRSKPGPQDALNASRCAIQPKDPVHRSAHRVMCILPPTGRSACEGIRMERC